MTPLTFFAHVAGLSTVSFLVFLNFMQNPALPEVSPVVPVAPLQGGASTARIPGSTDRTSFGTMPTNLGAIVTVPSDVPRPVQTNRFWSGGTNEAWPSPMFALPLMGTLSPNGFELNAPGRKTGLPHAIMHVPTDILRVFAPGTTATHARPVSSGDFDVTFRQFAGSTRLFDVTMVEGSPFAFIETPLNTLTVVMPAGSRAESLNDRTVVVRAPARTYLVSSKGAITVSGGELKVTGGLLSIGVVPGNDPAVLLPYALSIPRGTRASWNVLPDRVETTFRLPMRSVVGLFPHHKKYLASSLGTSLGSIETVRGPLEFYIADSFRTSLPRPPVLTSLPVTESARTSAFRKLLDEEVLIGVRIPGDVYVAGKEAYRLATLAEIAAELGDASLKQKTTDHLRTFLSNWCTASPGETANYFAYDQKIGGLVAIPPAFGSEHYNDHHFHYGYFIRAGAVAARLDPTFDRDFGTCMRAMMRDIASADRNDTSYPYLRYFDTYAGHSWAGGLTRFNDGNNQESTSEAMQAWFGIALYGKTIGDQTMEDLGTWLLAEEAAATKMYWMRSDTQFGAFPGDFPDPMISILWNGKADYATFFDASPGAIHGIQFFPATTALLPILDRDVLTRLVDPLSSGTPRGLWETTLSLVAAIGGKNVSIPADVTVDPVYSRVAMEQFVGALKDLGSYESRYRTEKGCGAVFVKNGARTLVTYRFASAADTCVVVDAQGGAKSTVRGLAVGWNRKTF